MEYNEIAAKRRKKRKNSFIYAPFAHFCGNSLLPICSLCKRLLSISATVLLKPLQPIISLFPGAFFPPFRLINYENTCFAGPFGKNPPISSKKTPRSVSYNRKWKLPTKQRIFYESQNPPYPPRRSLRPRILFLSSSSRPNRR